MSGEDDWSLRLAAGLFCSNVDAVLFTYDHSVGCIRLDYEGEDSERCVVLATDFRHNPDAWSLIDYRTVFTDEEVERCVAELRSKLDPEVRAYISVETTQDLSYREYATPC